MSGYLGDLSEKQEQALNEFKRRIQDIWKEEFTDHFLLRWLRAREFDINKAEYMLRQNQIWRRENNIDSVLETYQWPQVLKTYFPGGMCNHDRSGRPVWIMRFGNADYKGMLECVPKEEMFKVCYYQIEQMFADMRRQSKMQGKNVETVTILCDYDNFSLNQVYSFKAPSFFPIFWKIFRTFLSEKTATKVEVFPRDVWKSALVKYVDPSQLPVHWGGEVRGPDGDPECSNKVGRGGKVPVELYLKNGPKVWDDPHSVTCSLERGEHIEVPVQVERDGCILRWKFQTGPGDDVDFSVTRGSTNSVKGKAQVIPVTRIKCDLVPEKGQLESLEKGAYTFRFDNNFSWFTKKRLSYVLQVIYPEDVVASGS